MLALHDWQNFYMLTGTAAATLIGLLFVAISIGGYIPAKQAREYTLTFVNPTLMSYAQVLLLSCLAIMPLQNALIFRIAIIILSILNIFLAFKVLWRIRVIHQDDEIDRDHWLWHIVLPGIAGLLFAGGAISLFFEQQLAPLIIAVAELLCLTIGLRNTWTLMLWLTINSGVRSTLSKSVDEKAQ